VRLTLSLCAKEAARVGARLTSAMKSSRFILL
jgi:hypothetical protein